MKKFLSLFLVVLTCFMLVACGESSTPAQGESSSPTETDSTAAENTGEGDLGDYHVRVTGYHLAKSYDDKDVIILDYEFTNNDEDATSAETALYIKMFQDGIQLESAIVIDDSYDSDNGFKDIKTGVTLPCQCAYELENTTSPVEVEISKLFSFSDATVTYVINLSE
ncbi:MAG: DUF5067 domain-containing protein [Oscillospiraceae bacterium]|nr:DUF5067 domain-containing protein [Oscillospiraceae bacterium]